MYNGYNNENREYFGFGHDPEERTDAQWGVQAKPENFEWGAPAGAPAERKDAPIPEKMNNLPRRFPRYSLEQGFAPRSDEWSEPIYTQMHETMSNMYTPGIYVDPQHSRKRGNDLTGRKPKVRTGRLGRFLRVACLVLLCVILSGAATYGVMEYRIVRGDFTVVNQVVLGGNADSQNSGRLTSSVTTAGAGMLAEDIYIMACTQVVSITTKSESVGGIFNSVIPGTSQDVSAGSGFIISNDGYILTNYHVVEMAYNHNLPIVVAINDGSEYEAQVIGFETNNDVAIIKIEATGLNPAIIANSDLINVGQTVYAVGNPFGELVYTMTDGIVSARDREVSVEGKTINTFQISAAVNSGNSGGPVYNSNGEVIGIVTAKPMRNSVEGIGFAIPINDAMEIAVELIEHGYITGRPLMGITALTVTSANAEFYGWVVGAYVRSVNEDSAAEKAGIIVGDIITGLGDTEVGSMEALIIALRRYRAGDTTDLTVWRSGEDIRLTITFDEDLGAGQAKPRE